jgi:N-acetylglutamate synthase-like GNAT family acetyltransferase
MTKAGASLIARHATSEDASGLERLYTQLSPQNDGVSVDPGRLDQIAEDPVNLILVIEWNENIVATALLTICLDVMFGRQPFGVVENVVVDTEYRARGFGRTLLDAIDCAALSADCSKVMLLSAASRGDAHAYFKAMGYNSEAKRGFVKYRSGLEATIARSPLRAV